jgi:hypothetical protein
VELSIAQAVRRYSVRPAARARVDELDPDDVVLVPPPNVAAVIAHPRSALVDGFALARRLLEQGRTVRLIGEGATLAAGWPGWIGHAEGLVLTELGAYRDRESRGYSQSLREGIERWLDDTFAGVLPDGLSPSTVFYSVACARLFQPLYNAAPFIDGLIARHAGARLVCADPDWVGLAAIARRRANASGSPAEHRAGRGRPWGARLWAAVTRSVVRSAAGQLRAHYLTAKARSWLRVNRVAGDRSGGPDLWLGVVPCWGERANQHVLESVAEPAFERGLRIGILMTTSLDGGAGSKKGDGAADLWPVLAPVLPPARDVTVEQVVLPESLAELRSVLAGAASGAARVADRLARQGPHLDIAGFPIDLSVHLSSLARLVGTDLMVALATGKATEAVLARHKRAVPVVFSALGFVESAAPNAWLRHAGLPTVDFVHGTGADTWQGAAETRAAGRAVWTRGDAETVGALGQRAIVIGVPRLDPPRPLAPGPPRRVIVLSNYVHESWRSADYPLRIHQAELLRAIQLLRARFAERFEYRWRPHPSDNSALVEAGLRVTEGLVLSADRSLAEDLEWSDIVISSNSSSSIEALLWGRPVFLHASPAQRFLPEVRAFAEQRRFFYAHELPDLFQTCVAAMDAGDSRALDLDTRARNTLHGPEQPTPAQVLNALQTLGPC